MDQHRVALVTGGTRGIGAAIIGALAADDIHVAAGYSRNRGAADDMAANLAVAGHSVSLHQGNVGVPEESVWAYRFWPSCSRPSARPSGSCSCSASCGAC